MAMRMDYEVRLLDDSFKREITHYAFEDVPNGRLNRWGEKPKRMVEKKVIETGGVLIVVRGKPGHSIRLDSLEQALDFKLIDLETYEQLKRDPKGLLAMRPRLVDLSTGEEVNENGVPVNIARELEHGTTMPKNASKHARGNVETDIDVNTTGDESIAGDELPVDESIMAGHATIKEQLDEVE